MAAGPSLASVIRERQFDDNRLLAALFGRHDEHLVMIERMLGVSLRYRGNRLTISGPADEAGVAETALDDLYGRLQRGGDVTPADVRAAVRLAEAGESEASQAHAIRTQRRVVRPRSPNQARYLAALGRDDLVFGVGPAGTGKTYLAVAVAVALLQAGEVERIILSRPAVEAGERLGFLPGDLRDKVDPYLRPLYDALHDMMPGEQVARRMESGDIEVAPLAFMRGRTLTNAYIILDEAQNATPAQMKMFLTRMGENSRMAVTGDLTQVDLPPGQTSGLRQAIDLLERVEGISVQRFSRHDVVRHPLVGRIVDAYERRTSENQNEKKPAPTSVQASDHTPTGAPTGASTEDSDTPAGNDT
ncbi:MAG: PhoH family protein [Alphaproteobacteria bacterium]